MEPKTDTPTGMTTGETIDASKDAPQVAQPISETPAPVSTPQKAVMRTFSSDITESAPNESEANRVIQKVMPQQKTVPLSSRSSSATTAQAPKQQTNAQPNALVHTYKNDLQNLVKHQKLSLTKIAAIEGDFGTPTRGHIDRTNNRPSAVMVLAVVALIALATTVGAIMAMTQSPSPTTNTNPMGSGLFFTESQTQVDLTNKNMRAAREAFAAVRKKNVFSTGSFVELVPVYTVRDVTGNALPYRVSAQDLVDSLGITLPLLRESLGQSVMVGLHITDENKPFFVFTITDYDHAFAGMLAWEKTIEEDLAPFMSPNVVYSVPIVSSGSGGFTDVVVRNYDVRILRDSSGATRMVYSFLNRNTLVITTNVATLSEIANRIAVATQ